VVLDRTEVIDRLDFLRRTDPKFARFGAAKHRYLLNPPLPESEVTEFEARHGVLLPVDYRAFLLDVGDGGAGPSYGVYRLDRSDLYPGDPQRREELLPGFLAVAFPHAQSWNDPPDRSPEAEEKYFDSALIRGSLSLSPQGCGYMVRLVLNGPQRGTLWEDGRCSDAGITPFAPSFTTWYQGWLDDPRSHGDLRWSTTLDRGM
jgi:hypothetical protein